MVVAGQVAQGILETHFFLSLQNMYLEVACLPFPSNVEFQSLMCQLLTEGLKLLSFTYFNRGGWGHGKEGHFLSLSIG